MELLSSVLRGDTTVFSAVAVNEYIFFHKTAQDTILVLKRLSVQKLLGSAGASKILKNKIQKSSQIWS